jgi:hypothetical protein
VTQIWWTDASACGDALPGSFNFVQSSNQLLVLDF